MQIDGNQKEKQAMAAFRRGERKEGERLQAEFVAEFRTEYQNKDHCPCKTACLYHGDCKACVVIHRGHMDHLPMCMHPAINDKLLALSALTEHSIKTEI